MIRLFKNSQTTKPNMSNKTQAIEGVKLLKEHEKQIIPDKKKLEEIRPTILPHLINKLTQLIGKIQQLQYIDHEFALQQNAHIKEISHAVFSGKKIG